MHDSLGRPSQTGDPLVAVPILVLSQVPFNTSGHISAKMPTSRFEPSTIKNKIKREEVANKQKKAKNQQKLQKRLAQAKQEANDPAAKKVISFPGTQIVQADFCLETSC